MNEFNLTADLISKVKKRLADLQIQSMIFDMDIDIETLTLVEKSDYQEEAWLTRWKEKCQQSDNMPGDSEQNLGEDS